LTLGNAPAIHETKIGLGDRFECTAHDLEDWTYLKRSKYPKRQSG